MSGVDLGDECRQAIDLAEVSWDMAASLALGKFKSGSERLTCSTGTKALLTDPTQITIRVGAGIVAVGRKIGSFAFNLVQPAAKTSFICGHLGQGLIHGR